MQVDGEVDVDEQVAVEVERAADPVAGIGAGEDALERRRLLACNQRHPHPHPHGSRPGLEEAALDEPVLDPGVVTDIVAGVEEVALLGLLGRWRLGPAPGGAAGSSLAEPGGDLDLGARDPPAARPHDHPVVVGEQRRDHLHAPPRPLDLCIERQPRHRHRPQDLVGGPSQLPAAESPPGSPEAKPRTWPGIQSLESAPDQRRGRAHVLAVGVPRPARELGRLVAAIGCDEEGLGHARDSRLMRNEEGSPPTHIRDHQKGGDRDDGEG